MSAPIGHIEFLVKFDTIPHEFEKSLRNVIGDIDVDVSGGFRWNDSQRLENVEEVCEEILYLIKERLRTPFTGAWENFLTGLGPEITFVKDEMTKLRLAEILRTAPTAKRLYGELTQEEAEEQAEDILNQYIIMLEKSLDKKIFKKNKEQIVDLTAALNQILMGRWQYLTEPFIQQITDKEFLAKQYKKLLEKLGIEAEIKPRQWAAVKGPIEYGRTVPARRKRLPVKSIDDLIRSMNALIKEMSYEKEAPDIFKRIFAGKPTLKKEELEAPLGRFLKRWVTKYRIELEEIPRLIAHFIQLTKPKLAEKVWPKEIRRKGPRKDVFFMLSKKALEKLIPTPKEIVETKEIKEAKETKEIVKTKEIVETKEILDELEKFYKRHGVEIEKKEIIEESIKEIGVFPFFDKIVDIIERAETKKELGGIPLYEREELVTLTTEKLNEKILEEMRRVKEGMKHLLRKTESFEEKTYLRSILERIEDFLDMYGINPKIPKERR